MADLGRATQALLAVNGGFYGEKHGGWFMTHGKEKGKFVDNEFSSIAAFGKNTGGAIRAEIFPPEEIMPKGGGAPEWVFHGLTGVPMLVRDGEILESLPPDDFTVPPEKQGTEVWDTPNPRTAIGFTEDGHTMIVVVVDGRQPTVSKGMRIDQLAAFLARLGAWDALNLDGGCSSAMYVGTKDALVNSPCIQKDGTIRTVATHLAVVPLEKKPKLVSRILLGGAALLSILAG